MKIVDAQNEAIVAHNQGRIRYVCQMGYTSGTSAVPKRAVRVG